MTTSEYKDQQIQDLKSAIDQLMKDLKCQKGTIDFLKKTIEQMNNKNKRKK